MKWLYKSLFAVLLAAYALPAFCQDLQGKVARQELQARLAKAARVEIEFTWKKQEYLERRVRFRPGRKIRVAYPAKYKTTRCAGVLLAGSRVATAASCVEEKDGFKLQKVTFSFSNGKSGKVSGKKVRVNEGVALMAADPALTAGLIGAEISPVCAGCSLQDAYGKEFASGLQQFLLARGVVSDRAARLTGRKTSLQPGEPLFWKGKLVAVFNRVPSRLPVSLFGQISEDFLSVFR